MTNTTLSKTMKAVRIHAYGSADTISYEDAPTPTPGAGQVLVRVAYAGTNPIDVKITSGDLEAMMPIAFPYTLGFDLAGTVEAVGADVTDFAIGQAVYGEGLGTYAQYALAPTATLAAQPKTLSAAEAASVPMGAMTAWQGLFDHGGLQAGQTVLIQGASGGVGMFAVQFAKWRGARVLATASGEGVAFVQSLGADAVIDYETTRFEDEFKDVDLVLDLVGGDTQMRSFGVLKRGGILVSALQPPSPEEARAHGVRGTAFHMQATSALLQQIGDLIDKGKIKTVVTQTLPLSQATQPRPHVAYILGKTVLQVAP